MGAYAGRELPAGNIMSLMIQAETIHELDEAIPVLEESLRQLGRRSWMVCSSSS